MSVNVHAHQSAAILIWLFKPLLHISKNDKRFFDFVSIELRKSNAVVKEKIINKNDKNKKIRKRINETIGKHILTRGSSFVRFARYVRFGEDGADEYSLTLTRCKHYLFNMQ